MASVPFARRVSSDYVLLPCSDFGTEKPPRGKVHCSSSGVESFKGAYKSRRIESDDTSNEGPSERRRRRKRRDDGIAIPVPLRGKVKRTATKYSSREQDEQPLLRQDEANGGSVKSACKNRRIESDDTSNEGTSERRRRRKRRDDCIAIPVPLRGKVKRTATKYSSRDQDEQPLLRQDEANLEANGGSDEVFVDIPIEQDEPEETKRTPTSSTQRFCGVVLFLLFLVIGLTLIISVHVKSDVAAREIKPAHFHYYKITLIVIFILCLAFKCHKNWNDTARDKDFDPLIPSHLLTGLVLFGVCNSAFQIVGTLDFVKCSRNVTGLDKSYVATAIFETVFVFCQIYVFYTLSRRRKQILWFGNLFTMFTLAINLTLWAGYFCDGAVNHPDLKNVTWLRRYYYGLEEDMCALNNTGNYSRKLHVEIISQMKPYQFTFAMEYSILASALLLHVWLEIATPSAGEFGTTNKDWNVWRFGFIAGLFSLPLMGCVGVYSTVEYTVSNSVFLYTVQSGLMVLIFLGSCRGLWLFRKYYTRITDTKALKVDIILLCFSSLGFVILDLFTIFASLAEILKTYQNEIVLLGVVSLGELLCISVLTVFIYASYFYRMRLCDDGIKAAKHICQIASFCITVNVGFWAIRTYTFRSKYYFDIAGYQYFGPTAWFAITQFATPMCIFYYFHCAVCLSGIVADSSVRAWRKHITPT